MGDHADDTFGTDFERGAWWSPATTVPSCKWCGKALRWEQRAKKWLLMDGKKAHRCDEYLKR